MARIKGIGAVLAAFVAAVALAFVLGACGGDASLIRVGMSEAEVMNVVGAPSAIQELYDVSMPGANLGVDRLEFERSTPERIWHYMDSEVIFNRRGHVMRVDRRKVSWP